MHDIWPQSDERTWTYRISHWAEFLWPDDVSRMMVTVPDSKKTYVATTLGGHLWWVCW